MTLSDVQDQVVLGSIFVNGSTLETVVSDKLNSCHMFSRKKETLLQLSMSAQSDDVLQYVSFPILASPKQISMMKYE